MEKAVLRVFAFAAEPISSLRRFRMDEVSRLVKKGAYCALYQSCQSRRQPIRNQAWRKTVGTRVRSLG